VSRPMAQKRIESLEELSGLVGQDIGPSEWRTVSQEMINAFADVSGDHQWIHVDVERAKQESPFGGTVAHGNLTLSLTDSFRLDLIEQKGVVAGVNYGFDKVRFPAPVLAGSRVRCLAKLVAVDELEGGWWHVVTRLIIEVEGNDKPACVADSVGRALAG
jgi:acyl dehydratase